MGDTEGIFHGLHKQPWVSKVCLQCFVYLILNTNLNGSGPPISRNYSGRFLSSRPVNVSQLIFHLIKNLVISSLSIKSQWFPNPSHNTHSFSRCGSRPPVQHSLPATSPGHASLSHFQARNALSVTHPAYACLLFTFHDTWTLFSKASCSLSPPAEQGPPCPPVCSYRSWLMFQQ